jgi:hypothetical protein
MSNRPGRVIGFALCVLLIGTPAGQVLSQVWVHTGETSAERAKRLIAQRREIEEVKAIFARIDGRLIQIHAIHQRMERILSNPEATSACAALEDIQRTQKKLATEIEKAPNEQERARLESDQVHYNAVFTRAQAAFKKLDCRD